MKDVHEFDQRILESSSRRINDTGILLPQGRGLGGCYAPPQICFKIFGSKRSTFCSENFLYSGKGGIALSPSAPPLNTPLCRLWSHNATNSGNRCLDYLHAEADSDCTCNILILNSTKEDQWGTDACGVLHLGSGMCVQRLACRAISAPAELLVFLCGEDEDRCYVVCLGAVSRSSSAVSDSLGRSSVQRCPYAVSRLRHQPRSYARHQCWQTC